MFPNAHMLDTPALVECFIQDFFLEGRESKSLTAQVFGQNQASSAVLGQLGDGDCHLMHRIQSGGWLYPKGR